MILDEIRTVHDVMLGNHDKYPEYFFRLPWACRIQTNTGAEITKWFRSYRDMNNYDAAEDPELDSECGMGYADHSYYGYDPVSGTYQTTIVNVYRNALKNGLI